MTKNIAIIVLASLVFVLTILLAGMLVGGFTSSVSWSEAVQERERLANSYRSILEHVVSNCTCSFSELEGPLEEHFEIRKTSDSPVRYNLYPKSEDAVSMDVFEFSGVAVETEDGRISEIYQYKP